jgi:hypothetical protein
MTPRDGYILVTEAQPTGALRATGGPSGLTDFLDALAAACA